MVNFNNTASSMYAQDLDSCVNIISAIGHQTTVMLQGDIGTGKSATRHMLNKMFPTHRVFYLDCTTKDVGDLMLPKIMELDENDQFVRYVTNEEIGLHVSGPVIIMVDEFGKANKSVQNALLCLMYERFMGSMKLHPESIVYATTNHGAEGVGDMLPPHTRNRMTVIPVKKWDNEQWIGWGINNGVDHNVLLFAKEHPEIFHSFTDVKDPESNPYIFHPKVQRAAFITPRSLENASNIVKVRDRLGADATTAALIGTIGERGGLDLSAQLSIADQLTSLEDIKNNPKTAKVPENAAAICMIIYRTMSNIDRSWIDAWMDYFQRLPAEAQGMFVNGVYADKFDDKKRTMVCSNRKFTDFTKDNAHLSAADKT